MVGEAVLILQISALDNNAFILSAALAFISFCVHPFIYASRYEVFRRYLKQMLNRSSVIPDNAGEVINSTQAARVQH